MTGNLVSSAISTITLSFWKNKMTIEELMELLAESPQGHTVMVGYDDIELVGIEYGRDFIGQRDIIILLGG